jgi:hypothetical protein
MKNKALLVILTLTLAVSALLMVSPAVSETADASKGLPYNDYEKYTYFVQNGGASDYGTKSGMQAIIPITVRDKNSNIILSHDTVTIKFDGLPQSKLIAQEGELKFNAGARFDFELHIPAPLLTSEKEVERLWENWYVKNYPNMQKTTLFGRPALQSVNDTYADYIIYLNDVKLPNSIAVFKISIRSGFDFAMQSNTTQADLFREKYQAQQIPVFLDLNAQFQAIRISFEKRVQLRTADVKTGPEVNQVQNTQASETSGETGVVVAIVIVLGGLAAGAAGVGIASGASIVKSGSSDDSKEDKGDGNYKMGIQKDFGDTIKYNSDTVYVYARMIEVNLDGTEIDRPDLTQKISIFSDDPLLEVSPSAINGAYMGAGVIGGKSAGPEVNEEAVISFRFAGEGGTFQNNIKFRVVGDSYISLENEKIFLLTGSGRSFEMPYSLVNFVYDADEVTVNQMTKSVLFDLTLGKDTNGKSVIIATDKTVQKPIENFFESFTCEIIAKNKKEQARSVFTVVLCYEGVLPDFLGKEKEIVAYKNTEGELPKTNIAFRLGTWDETKKTLNITRPGEVEVTFTDEQGIFEVIGLENEIKPNESTSDYLMYGFKAEKSLPSISPISGTLSVAYQATDVSFESDTKVKLVPDLLTYEKDMEKEYQNCIRIIDTYLPPEFSTKKHRELDTNRSIMGLKDLQLFRRKCWEIASRCIMQEKENYLIASYWYDEAIAKADLVVYVGDIALDVALAPFGGPITGFVVSQVKSALIELISIRIEKGAVKYDKIYNLILKRLEQAAGQADGLIETPGFDKPKVLAAWLSTYILYRIMYRWYFDKDDADNPKGLVEAIQNGLMDFAGKGASILLGEFAKGIAKNRGIDVGSTADKEQKWVNEKVGDAAKKGLDVMDSVADALDQKIKSITTDLIDFIDRIKTGGINIS